MREYFKALLVLAERPGISRQVRRSRTGVGTIGDAARNSSSSGVAGWNRKVPSTVRADRRRRAGVFPITCVEVAPEYRSKAQVSSVRAPRGGCGGSKRGI